MIWNKEAESMRSGEREKLQLERLKAILKRAHKNVPYYHVVDAKTSIGAGSRIAGDH